MEKFTDILKERFGENEPSSLKKFSMSFPTSAAKRYTRRSTPRWRKLASPLRSRCVLPATETRLGKSRLSARQVATKRWLESDGEVYGYTSGFNLANESGVSDQVPNTLEITTNKEKTRVRDVKPFGGWKRVTLRRPRRPVNARNVDALRFLDLITTENIQFFDEYEMDALRKLARKAGRTMIYDCSASYPGRTAKKLAECERYRVFA